ncbi:MAG: flagellar hook-length control protein FliK [bacterium]
MDAEQMKTFLKDIGVEPDKKNMKILKNLVKNDLVSDIKSLKKLFDHRSMVMNESGEVDTEKIKKLNFMIQNDVPLNKQLFEDLKGLPKLKSMESLWTGQSSLSSVDPSQTEQLAKSLQKMIREMGMDLERMIESNPEQARDTVRSQAHRMMLGLSSPVQSTVTGGGGAEGASMGSGEANQVFNQIMKHALASLKDDGATYLFFPFKEGEETKFMQVRFQDEREGVEGEDYEEEKWSVTVDIELSQIGSVRFQARRHYDQLGIHFYVERADTTRLIRRNRSQLKETFEEMGYNVSIRAEHREHPTGDLIDEGLKVAGDQEPGKLDLTI